MTNNISRFLVPLVIVQFFLLILQFILGMWINLFAPMNIPTTQYSGMMGGYLMGIMVHIPEIMAHMMVGILIGLLALITLFVSIFTGKFTIILFVAINGILTLMAGIYGLIFLLGGMQNNILSFIMAMGFIGVVLSDFGIIYFIDQTDRQASKTNSNAIATLRERYAKGEITKDQFDKMMEDLKNDKK